MSETNGLPILSHSRLRDFRACPKRHHFKYDLGYRPAVDAEALHFGSFTHGWLEAWWDAAHAGQDRLEAALAFVSAPIKDGKPMEVDVFDRMRAEAMARGYHARWSEEPLRVLGVEVEFRAPLINPATGAASKTYQLGGKMDAIAVTIDGRPWVIEHKSTTEDVAPGSDYYRRLRIGGQGSMYIEGARSLGLDVQGVVYDLLRKPALRPLKKSAEIKLKKDGTPYANQRLEDETPEEYRVRLLEAIAENPNAFFARAEVVRHEAETEEAQYDAWQLARVMREGELAGRFPRNEDSCIQYGSACPFFPVCCGEASLDDPEKFRRSTNIHPELAATAA